MKLTKIFLYFKLKDDSVGIEEFETIEQAMKVWIDKFQYAEEVIFIEGRRIGVYRK